jgi:hypothetical protein
MQVLVLLLIQEQAAATIGHGLGVLLMSLFLKIEMELMYGQPIIKA